MRRITTTPATSTPHATPPPLTPTSTPSGPPGWTGRDVLSAPETARVLHAVWSGDPLTLVPSPPGAGKTRLVALLAAALCTAADLRVGIAAQTRAQAVELARRVAPLTDRAVLAWAAKGARPDVPGMRVAAGRTVGFPQTHGGIVIATTARWLYARPHELGCDVMLVDEAWQATYADVGALGAFAPQIVCVGDPGQIDPVVTGSVERWRLSPSGPHLPAPIALTNAHGPAATRVALRHTWRLGPATTRLIQSAFYPDLPFTSKRPPEHIATPGGDVLPEWTTVPVTNVTGPADAALITACADRARMLLGHTLVTGPDTRPLEASDLAVVTAHVGQAAAVRAALSAHPEILVGTANQLQGLERAVVVALHPLVGAREITDFTADTGRACVMLSRHRAHVSIVMDTATPNVLAAADTRAPGVLAHRSVTAALLSP